MEEYDQKRIEAQIRLLGALHEKLEAMVQEMVRDHGMEVQYVLWYMGRFELETIYVNWGSIALNNAMQAIDDHLDHIKSICPDSDANADDMLH